MVIAETTAAPASGGAPYKPSVPVKVFYSLGQVAQSGGFDAAIGFIFFYYSVALGLSGLLVGAALAVSLAFDAFVDPIVGSWSDNVKSRLGRRLPLMIAAAPLLAISIGLLFSPPAGLGQVELFYWLAATSTSARSFISLFNVPYIALGAEMATDPVERTRIVVYRAMAGIFAGVLITAVGYTVFFAGGRLQRPEEYPGFGWSVAGLLFLCTALCCVGTYRYAANLPQPDQVAGSMLSRLPRELAEVFANKSFRILFFSAVVVFLAIGLNASLNNHAFVFVWRLKSETIQFIGYAYLFGILLGVSGAPMLERLLEKKYVVIVGFALLIANWLILQGAMLAGVYLPLGNAALLPMQFNSFVAGIGVGFVSIAFPSMMADAADEHEHLFGRRREGLYFAGLGFAGKAAQGLGVMLAGVALDVIQFPKDVARTVAVELPVDLQHRLVLIWGPGPAILALVSLLMFATYALTRARHAEIVRKLRPESVGAKSPRARS